MAYPLTQIERLVGRSVRSVSLKDHSWIFSFGDDITLWTEGSWRFMDSEHIVITSEDHRHQFGLPAPVDAAEWVHSRVSEALVTSASINTVTGDLIVAFGGAFQLQLLQMSFAYESWRLYASGNEVICLGGGRFDSVRRVRI
jgi:hypothetical protein